ncbi:MAG: hypothetical protein AAF587_15520 [Bacteroidota bacterium]
MNILRKTFSILIGILLLGITLFILQLFYRPSFQKVGKCHLNKDLIEQLAYLEEELHGGAGRDMQALFPEGFVFLNALYGLTWIELAQHLEETDELYAHAHQEIAWVVQELNSEQARSTFDEDMPLPYGIFYRGWSNYVLGKKLMIEQPADRDSAELTRFHQNCQEIKEAMSQHSSPFLSSYRGASWPADMFVGMASISLHAELFDDSYEQDIHEWLSRVQSSVDTFGLIPHQTDPMSGEVLESARGSSQSLILNFLHEIDSGYAYQQFEIYKNLFLSRRLGMPGIREYPQGRSGGGDIDSGPVIWGIGGAASIVGQRTMALYGESAIAIGLRNSIETFGAGRSKKGKKRYLYGMLTMADAFIAWSNSTEAYKEDRLQSRTFWQIRTFLYALPLLLIGGIAAVRLWRK